MSTRSNLVITFAVVVFGFSVLITLMTLYRTSMLMNRYFPGFFLYYTRVISIYDIPEWWAGKTSGIPIRAVLVKLNDKEIETPKDFWEVVSRNLDKPTEFKVEYEVGGKRHTKFVKSQKFEIKDFIAFSLFWQVSGFLLLLLGFIVYLGNRSKKGELWLIANTLTGVNFLTTPASLLMSDVLLITLTERISFSLFPISMVWLFLNFPLVKFRKQTRLLISSLVGSIGASFLIVSILGYIYPEEVSIFQEMYYLYPAIGGLSAVFSSVYDYIRAKKHKLYQLSEILFPLAIGALMFMLFPSILAILTTIISFPSYYIPILAVGYPILVIVTIMIKSLQLLREVSVNLSVIVTASLVFTVVYVTLIEIVKGPLKFILFSTIGIVLLFLFLPISSLIMKGVRRRSLSLDRELMSKVIEKFRKLNKVSKIQIFLNTELGKILGFSFSKFVSYKAIPKEIRKFLFFFGDSFISREDLDERISKKGMRTPRDLAEPTMYVMIIKHNSRFFGVVALGKKITGDVLTRREVEFMRLMTKIISGHIDSLVRIVLSKENSKILKRRSRGISSILVKSLLVPTSVHKGKFSLRVIVKDELDKPVIYKVSDRGEKTFFCVVWILPESVHTFVLASVVKGVLEEYFLRGRVDIYRLPREIRNIICSVSPVEVDANILCGVITDNTNSMEVVNDGKTSIVLVTKKHTIIPMPLHKRYFSFSKMKDGDRFLFITGEEITTQLQEIKEMEVRGLDPDKFFYDFPDKVIVEVSFRNIGN